HPAKLEVRFSSRAQVEACVEAAVREALSRVDSAATLDRRVPLPQLRREAPAPATVPAPDAGQLAFFVAAAERVPPGDAAESVPDPVPGAVEEHERSPLLWQLHDSYILAETRTGLLIIDQHSAHERILFQDLMNAYDRGGAPSQRLLFPITLRLTPAEYALVLDARELFERTGFEMEPFGGRTIIIQAAPAPHPWFNAERCAREMIAELSAGSEPTRSARTPDERMAATFAC